MEMHGNAGTEPFLQQGLSTPWLALHSSLSISTTTCAAINQGEGEQSWLAEEQQKENTLQAI